MIKIEKREDITLEYLSECFVYDSGRLFWKSRPENHFETKHGWCIFNGAFSGQEAGGLHKRPDGNRWRIVIAGIIIYRHRLVWAIHNNGVLPPMIDHINRDPLDDRIENLRLTNKSRNGHNQLLSKNNTSGFTGVYWNKARGRWAAQIMVNRKNISLGEYKTPEEAHQAYMDAAHKYFGEFAVDRRLS